MDDLPNQGGLKGKRFGKGELRYPSDPFKFKYMINRQGTTDTHSNLFDGSFTEYFYDDDAGHFDILFDSKLYEPPTSVIEFEKKMIEEQEAALNQGKTSNR